MKKILIIKPSSFGDIVQANPTLAALREAYPGAAISWLVFDAFEKLVALFPGVSRVITWKRRGGVREFLRVAGAIRSERFDLIVDLQGLARTSLLSLFSGAGRRIGVPGMKEGSWLLTREVFPESRGLNAVERSLETVRYLTGKRQAPAFLLRADGAGMAEAERLLSGCGIFPSDRLIVLVPSARSANKVWPAEHYRALVELMASSGDGMKIAVVGGMNDRGLVRHAAAIDLCGRTDAGALAAVLGRAALVIGGDTGPVHLAAGLGVRAIALFGGSDVRETAPSGAAVLTKNYPCSPCRSRPSCNDVPCLKEIRPEEVFEKAKEIIGNKA